MEAKVICILIDLLMVVSYLIIGTLFLKSNGKGCDFISGYNMKSPAERKKYDEVKICIYFGKIILGWSLFFVAGAVVDYFAPGVGLTLGFVLLAIALIYLIVYIRIIKFDEKFKIVK